jgi:hypothetical protein
MGKIAVTIVGTVIGAYFGYPQLGFLLGSLVGALAFPDKGPNMSGPRLDNLMVTGSTYGQPIPIVYGTFRLAGNMIWSKGIREIATKEEVGGKGGGPTVTSYQYRWSGAIGICEGPIAGVTRIWADSKLVYDTTGGSALLVKEGFTFREYIGDEEQLPDPAWEADVGAGNLSANRGLAYIVFDDIPIQDYGNRIPNFTFEVSATGQVAPVLTVIPVADLAVDTVPDPVTTAMVSDWNRNVFYRFHQDGLHVYDINTQKEIRQISSVDIFNPDDNFVLQFAGSVCTDSDGYIYTGLNGGNSRPIAQISPDTFREISRVGVSGSGLDPATSVVASSHLSVCEVFTTSGVKEKFLISCAFSGAVQVIGIDPPSAGGLERVGYYSPPGLSVGVPGPPEEGNAVVYFTSAVNYGSGASAAPIEIYKMRIAASAADSVVLGTPNLGISVTKIGELLPPEVVPASETNPPWTQFTSFGGGFYDFKTDRIYWQVAGRRAGLIPNAKTVLVRYDPATDTVERYYDLDGTPNVGSQQWPHYNVTDSRIAFVRAIGGNTSSVQIIDLETGESSVTSPWLATSGGCQLFDGRTGYIITEGTTSAIGPYHNCILPTGRNLGGTAVLGDIVENLCGRAGLAPSDISVTELTDEVPGYLINSQMTVRSAIEPLAVAYKFDGVESDYLLKFLKRGRASTLTITQDKLKFLDEATGDVIRETRIQEVDMPERVSVIYADAERDYQQNTQTTKRVTNPTPTMYTKNQATMTLPISLDSTFAKKLSYTMLNTAWIERISTEFHSGWEFLKLDPVDAVTVNLDNGTVYQIRLIQMDVGVDMSLQFQAVNEKATSYTAPTALAGDSGAFTPPTIPMTSFTKTFVFDSPLLQDSDDPGQNATIMYAMIGNYTADGSTPGVEIQRSNDGSFWSRVAQVFSGAAWGSCVNTLGDPADPFVMDTTNTLSVHMSSGADQLADVTDLELANGANGAMVINFDTGNIEILQFRDVTLEANGTYTLSNLWRGRRGTDTMSFTHSGEEFFMLLNAADVEAFQLNLTEIGLDRFYKGIQFGTLFEEAVTQTAVSQGFPLWPYAPVHYAVDNNAGDYDITWERRTRLNGNLADGTPNVPLSETTEAYEIDIWNGAGDTVLRTLTSTTTLKKYLAADIATDFGTPPATITLSIYQMSGAVGRGFGYKTTVTVT